MSEVVRLAPNDHVVIALRPLAAGDTLRLENGRTLRINEDIPVGHKVLTEPVAGGADVLKYGYSIGKAIHSLNPGDWVHTHNMASGLHGKLDYQWRDRPVQATAARLSGETAFLGYEREDGRVGIRNEIWILNTVGCINKTCETLVKQAGGRYGNRVDGVFHYAHPYGCSQLGDDLTYTQKLLAALAHHPNAAGILVVGLGCENNQIDSFRAAIGPYDPRRIKFMKVQEVEDELETGMSLLDELVSYAETFRRKPVPVSKLVLGLKCGGSDGFSGITANPLVGAVSDRLVAAGGASVLTEVPEMFGAETILMNRAESESVFHRIEELINGFKDYFIRHGQEIYENPSPGNKAGGITTLEEKSLGCTQKAGHAVVTDVLRYGERVTRPGLNVLEAPGNDLVSVTALIASGAQIVLFTTGRGTPFGGPVPTVKISSNTALAERKKNWIDFNAGALLEGRTMEELADSLWERILSLASGETRTHNETNGYREIAIFKDGVIL